MSCIFILVQSTRHSVTYTMHSYYFLACLLTLSSCNSHHHDHHRHCLQILENQYQMFR